MSSSSRDPDHMPWSGLKWSGNEPGVARIAAASRKLVDEQALLLKELDDDIKQKDKKIEELHGVIAQKDKKIEELEKAIRLKDKKNEEIAKDLDKQCLILSEKLEASNDILQVSRLQVVEKTDLIRNIMRQMKEMVEEMKAADDMSDPQ